MSYLSLFLSLLDSAISVNDAEDAINDYLVCQEAGRILSAAGVTVSIQTPKAKAAPVAPVAAAPAAKADVAVAPGVQAVADRFNAPVSVIADFVAANAGGNRADKVAAAVARFGISQADANWAADQILGAAPVKAAPAKVAAKPVKAADLKTNAAGLAKVARQFGIDEARALDFLKANPGASKTALIRSVRDQFGLRDVEATWAVEMALTGKAAITPAGF